MVGAVDAEDETAPAVPADADDPRADAIALLLFRAGSLTWKAVPLSLITRLEEIKIADIERCNGEDVVQYRGALMPLVYIDGESRRGEGSVQPVLVFTEGGRPVGLAVDEIVDMSRSA
jgi:two-component system, chemotaxis family, sensor kinase CheA